MTPYDLKQMTRNMDAAQVQEQDDQDDALYAMQEAFELPMHRELNEPRRMRRQYARERQ